MSLSCTPNSGNNGLHLHVAHVFSTIKWDYPRFSVFHSLCGPLTQFSFQSLGDNETLACLCIQAHSLTLRWVLAAEKAFPSSLLTSPSVRGLIFLAAISQARVFLPHLKLSISLFSSTFNLRNFTTALFLSLIFPPPLSFIRSLSLCLPFCLFFSPSAYPNFYSPPFSPPCHPPSLPPTRTEHQTESISPGEQD